MIAYHGQQAIKDKYLARVRAHREADELVQGFGYWKDGKGCAVGCTMHSDSHNAYETELGIPKVLARLEDSIFEGLSVKLARQWPERFLAAITPGANLSLVSSHFFIWLLGDPADGVIRHAKTDKTRDAIQRVVDLYRRHANGEKIAVANWQAAAAADDADAYASADAADAAAAAAYAAYASADAAAADADAAASAAADAAAYADADAAAYAAAAYADAAYADAAYAYAANAYAANAYAGDAADAARHGSRSKQADKLIELLAAAPMAALRSDRCDDFCG